MNRKVNPFRIILSLLIVQSMCISPVFVNAQPNSPLWDWQNLDILIEASDIDTSDYSVFTDYLKQFGQDPAEYLVDKCKKHQLVILGESHHRIEYERFMRDIIPDLYHKAGVRYIVFESIILTHNGKTETLVTAKDWNRSLAMEIARADGYSDWGDQEYWDILKAIWKLNQTLPEGSEPMHAIGMEIPKDYKLDKLWRRNKLEDKNLIARAESQHLFEMLRDENMAAAVKQYVLNKGGKGLVIVGMNHSFTHYEQTVLRIKDSSYAMPFSNSPEGFMNTWPRFGRILYKEYGDRIFQITLHALHPSPKHFLKQFSVLEEEGLDPAVHQLLSLTVPTEQPILPDLLEKIMSVRDHAPVGFDVVNSPYANLRDRFSSYFYFQPSVRFSDLSRGFIYLMPWRELTWATWMEGYISQDLYDNNKIYRMYYDLLYSREWKNARDIDNWYRDEWLQINASNKK